MTESADLLNNLLAGNKELCSNIIQDKLKTGIPIKKLYEDTLKTALYKVGELWEFNKISVATEHLASAIVEAILNEVYNDIVSGEKNQKSVIVSCVEQEFHRIGIKMVSDIFEMNGWNSYFLGANTPTSELLSFAEIIKPDIFAISLSIYFHLPMLETMITETRKKFPNIPILVGGQAFSKGGKDVIAKYNNVIYLPDSDSVDLYIKKNLS